MSAPGAVRAREPLLDRATRRRRRRVRVVEGLVFLLGYILYEVLHDLVPRQVATADSHGFALLHAEQHLGVACEQLLNQWLAARPTLAAFTIFWYSDAHFAVTFGLLLLTAKISGGRRWRLAWYVTTAIALLVFWLDPTAPPRLLPHAGFTDVVALLPSFGTVSDPAIVRLSNPFAAMPSLHVAWATWCAAMIWRLSLTSDPRLRPWVARSRARITCWALRVLAVAYPLITTWVVLATANHYLADVLAGVLTAALAFGLTSRRVTAMGRILRRSAALQQQGPGRPCSEACARE